jgi:hypothetical protein
MQLALATPLFRSVVLGGILFGLTVASMRSHTHHHAQQRLVLHTNCRPHTIYLTAWRSGALRATLEQGVELKPMTLETEAVLDDGCRWLGVERLTPIAKNRYFYSYDEELLGCEPGATPGYIKTPRTGIVTVE